MAIKKQEFYEGAALHLLVRSGLVESISYKAPFFTCNNRVSVLLKYTTKSRTPWGFTFTTDEQAALKLRALESAVIIGLVCGADGVAAFSLESFLAITAASKGAVHIACFRRHGEHYEVSGPDGVFSRKVAPSNWLRILEK